MTEHPIPDVQGSKDTRHIAITRVGIRDIRVPLLIKTNDGSSQATIAEAEMTVALPHEQKGTHMSRFINLLNETQALGLSAVIAMHRQMLTLLKAQAGTLSLDFPYFVKKKAPVSGVESLMDYQASLIVDGGEEAVLFVEVVVPVTSLCPCSKEISKYGAHNQRSHVIISAEFDPAQPFAIEDIIRIAEEESSCEMWSTLKRPDEKYVTEKAFENPKFVEDIVRDVAVRLNNDTRIPAYRVSSENFESIHNHSAYAVIEHDKRD